MEWIEVKKLLKPNGEEYPLEIFIDQLKSRRGFRDLRGGIYRPLRVVEEGSGWIIPARVELEEIEIYPFNGERGLRVITPERREFFPHSAVRVKVEEGIRKRLFIKAEKEREVKILIVRFINGKGMEITISSPSRGVLWYRQFGKKVLDFQTKRKIKLSYEFVLKLVAKKALQYDVDVILVVKPQSEKKVRIVDSFGYNTLINDLTRKRIFNKSVYIGLFICQTNCENRMDNNQLKSIYINLLKSLRGKVENVELELFE